MPAPTAPVRPSRADSAASACTRHPTLSSVPLPHPLAAAVAVASLRHVELTGDERSDHVEPPEATTSLLRFHLATAQPVLASVRLGKRSPNRNSSPELSSPHRRSPPRQARFSALPLALILSAPAPPDHPEATAPLHAPPFGRKRPPADKLHHRATMHAGEGAPEHFWPRQLHHQVCVES
jgi:hypothetical protein